MSRLGLASSPATGRAGARRCRRPRAQLGRWSGETIAMETRSRGTAGAEGAGVACGPPQPPVGAGHRPGSPSGAAGGMQGRGCPLQGCMPGGVRCPACGGACRCPSPGVHAQVALPPARTGPPSPAARSAVLPALRGVGEGAISSWCVCAGFVSSE